MSKDSRASYRAQLRAFFLSFYTSLTSAPLVAALNVAKSFKSRGTNDTHLFVAYLSSPPPLESGLWLTPLSASLAEQLPHPADFSALRAIHFQLLNRPEVQWSPPVCVAVATHPSSTSTSSPTLQQNPFGPALCSSPTECFSVVAMLHERLRRRPSLTLSVDLEGKLGGPRSNIALLQLCMESSDDSEPPLQIVLDIHRCPTVLRRRGSGSFCDILENPSVVKVLHCCRGDAAALHTEFDICLQGVFDTGIADCVLLRRVLNKPRKLQTVLWHWLGEENVPLQYKDGFIFTEHMFEERPLPHRLFVYAIEDVLFCNKLYSSLVAALVEAGRLELCLELCRLRQPESFLPESHPSHSPLQFVVAALVDQSSVLCLEDSSSKLLSLPSTPFVSGDDDPPDVVKRLARKACTDAMGPVPKAFAMTINQKLKRQVRLGDSLLYSSSTPDCAAALRSLIVTFAASPLSVTHRLRVVPFASLGTFPVSPASLPPLQCLRQLSEVSASEWSLRASRPPEPSVSADAAIVLGATVKNNRGALLLLDDTHVYLLRGSGPVPSSCFPSHQLDAANGSAVDAALKGFDLLAGPSLRKGGAAAENGPSLSSMVDFPLPIAFPILTGLLCAATAEPKPLGTFGNTEFFLARLEGSVLVSYLSSFVAARVSPCLGFRLTATLATRYPSFAIIPHALALEQLSKFDATALKVVLSPPSTPPPTAETAALAQQSDAETIPNLSSSLPAFGDDPAFDKLFDAAGAVVYSKLSALPAADGAVATSHKDVAGTPIVEPPPSREDIRLAQEVDPGCRLLLNFLKDPAAADVESFANSVSFVAYAARFLLDPDDGLLLRRTTGLLPLIVLPQPLHQPMFRFYHNRQGHFGVQKTAALLSDRFFWKSPRALRDEVAAFIRRCPVCSRTKVPRHKAGAAGALPVGAWPFDVTSADVYKTGWPSPQGHEDVVSFACHLTRSIFSEATPGDPTSELIADLLIRLIIRYYGCPRVFLSDSGSVFVSKAITYLFLRYGIRINPSSAYHHRTIGLIERWHSTLKHLLLANRASAPDLDWVTSLPLLNLALNTVINRCTQVSPSFALNLREVRLPTDLFYSLPTSESSVADLPQWVSDMLDAAHISYSALAQTLYLNTLANKKKFDLRRDTSLSFNVGDKVLVVKGLLVDNALPKAECPTTGPYTVCKRLPNDNYLLSGKGANRFRTPIHVDRLLHYLEERSDEAACRSPVEAIVAHRVRSADDARVVEYRVRWLGFAKSYDRWLSADYLTTVPHIVEAYCSRHQLPFNATPSEFVVPPATPVSLPPSPLAASGRHFRTHPDSSPPAAELVSTASSSAPPETPPPSVELVDAPPEAPELPLVPAAVDTSLPFVAKMDKGRWVYGCHRLSSQGLSTRWFGEKTFMPNDLASTHFSALRAAFSPNAPSNAPLPAP